MLSRIQLKTLRDEPLGQRPNKVQQARVLAGLTQEEVAAKIPSVKQTHISRIERGFYSRLPVPQARKLAKLFGCTIDDLFPETASELAEAS